LLRALGIAPPPRLPPHLQGVPRSLHKYEPLFKRSFAERLERSERERVGAR
jgi:hypothetical protein